MTSKGLFWMQAALLLVNCCAALGQSAQEPAPSLPSGPSPAPLVLPKSSGPVTVFASRPGDVPPPAPLLEGEDAYCTSPTDDPIKTSKPKTAEEKKAWDQYTRDIEPRIWKNWKPERVAHNSWAKGTQLRIRFEILQDGSLNDPVIMMTCGHASYDRNAMEAVRAAAPFASPPPGSAPIKACIHFMYYMEPKPRDPLPPDFFSPKTAKP